MAGIQLFARSEKADGTLVLNGEKHWPCVPVENLIAHGDGDLVINRNFTWSGPIAGIAAVGVARSAYEFAPKNP